jgi:hypothetical protein
MLRFGLFSLRGVGYEPEAVCVCQFAYEMGYLATLLPLRRVAPHQSFNHLNLFPFDDFIEYSSQRAASRVTQGLDLISFHGRCWRVDFTVPEL